MKDFPKNIVSKYKFIILSSQRCAQLLNGAKPKIETKGMVKSTTVAMNEVLDGKIEFDENDQEENKKIEEA